MSLARAVNKLRSFPALCTLKNPSAEHLAEREALVAIVEVHVRDGNYTQDRNRHIPSAELWADQQSKESRGTPAWTRAFLLRMDQLAAGGAR